MTCSIAVVFRLERSFGRYPDIGGLFTAQLRELHADTIKVQSGHLFVQVLGQDVYLVLVRAGIFPQFDLRQHLVGE